MNIQPLNYNFTHKSRYKSDYEHSHKQNEKKSAGLYGENSNRGYNVAFSGGQEQSVAAAKTLMGKILKSGWFKWLTEFSGEHNIASSALVSLFLAGLFRPAATLALPGKKDKEDKIYSAGHSMSSALVGFLISTAVTSPLDSGSKFMIKDGLKMSKTDFAKLSQDEINELLNEKYPDENHLAKVLEKSTPEELLARKFDKGLSIITTKTDKLNALKRQLKQTVDKKAADLIKDEIADLGEHLKSIELTMKNVTEWGIAIPRAMLTIALIPPILKYVFHLEKKKKSEAQPPAATTLSNVSMHDFMGGRK